MLLLKYIRNTEDYNFAKTDVIDFVASSHVITVTFIWHMFLVDCFRCI